MYALWIECCEPCCVLQNDDKFLTLLQSKIVEHITGKGMVHTEAIIRFVHAASSLEDLKLIVDAFVNNAYPALCKISWSIVPVLLPGEHEPVVEPVVEVVEPVVEVVEPEPINVVDEVLE
jgi:hypothetical protein